MSTITVKDGTTIYYKDWGKGPVVTFSHGWPLCSDAWDGQMLFYALVLSVHRALAAVDHFSLFTDASVLSQSSGRMQPLSLASVVIIVDGRY